MRHLLPPFALLILTCLVAVPPAGAADRVALVIGNGQYQNANTLPNPPNDARAIARALRDIGFQVSDGVDLNRAAMERLVRDFLRQAADARVALLFYAGHGMQVGGHNYLIPVDARLEAASDLDFETIELDKILDSLNDPGRANIVMLDACRDNPLARSFAARLGATRSAAVGAGLAAYSTLGTGTLIAFATAPGQVALDGDGANSPFTTGLLKHLRTPGLEVRQMLTRVRGDVAGATHNRQVPWDNSSLFGEVYLAGRGAGVAPTPAPVTPPPVAQPQVPAPDPAAQAWNMVKDVDSAAVMQAFIDNFPSSLYADFARARLKELERAAAPPPAVTPQPIVTPPPVAVYPSFPCAKATLAAEVAICGSSTLAQLDLRLAQLYNWRKNNSSGAQRRVLVGRQRAWLQQRNACGADVACLERYYGQQIRYLGGGN